MIGKIVDNTIEYDGFKAVLDPELYKQIPEYLEEMREELESWDFQCAQDLRDVLAEMNNDGSWSVVETGLGFAG